MLENKKAQKAIKISITDNLMAYGRKTSEDKNKDDNMNKIFSAKL